MTAFKQNVQPTRQSRSSDAEKQRQLDQLTAFANHAPLIIAELTTAQTNTLTSIWTSEAIPFNSTVFLQAKVSGDSADGSDYGYFEYAAGFQRAATGAATQQGSTAAKMAPIRSSGAIAVALGVDSDSKLYVQVNDGNQGTLFWKAWIEVRFQ